MSKTITFTNEELRVLEKYLLCNNPCYDGCMHYDVPDNVDCYDRKKNGEYKCPFMRTTNSIQEKLDM